MPLKPKSKALLPKKPIIGKGPKGTIKKSGDWVITDQGYDLGKDPNKRGLSLYGGTSQIVGYGNAGGTKKLNTLTAASHTGDVKLVAGTAATTMIGGSGNNFLDASGSKGNVSIKGGSGDSTMIAGSGAATLVGGKGNNSLWAGSGAQSLIGGAGSNTLWGGVGKTTLQAGSGTNSLMSGSDDKGSNTLIGGGVSSALYAGAGNDSLYAPRGNNTLIGGAGKVTLSAAVGSVLGVGSATANTWLESGSGLSGGNTLIGGAGSNTLVAGLGSDSIVGGDSKNLLLVNKNNVGSFANDSITLSTLRSASNTLGISATSPVNIADSLLDGMAKSGVKNLGTAANLSGTSSRILLGKSAEAVGIATLVSGTGSDTLSVAGYGSNSVTFDASKAVNRTSLVGGGTGGHTFLGSRGGYDTMIGAAGNDVFVIQAGASNGSSFGIINGNGGSDILRLNAEVNLAGTNFNGISNVEVLELAAGNNKVGSLQGSGIQRIVGNSGSDTLSANVYGAAKSVVPVGSRTITLNLFAGSMNSMGFKKDQAVTGNGIALGTTIKDVTLTPAVGTTPGTVTITLSAPTIALISQGGIINGWIDRATLDGGTNTTSGTKGDYLVGNGTNQYLIGASGSNGQLLSNTLVSGAFDSNTLIGGPGANLYLINNLPNNLSDGKPASLPAILNPTNIQSASTIQFTGNNIQLNDKALSSVSAKAAQKIITANGNNLIAIGVKAAEIGIQTIIGGVGSDTFTTDFQRGFESTLYIVAGTPGESVIRVEDPSEIAIGNLIEGKGIADGTTVTGFNPDTGEITLSESLGSDFTVGDTLRNTPLIAYSPSVYFDASRGSGSQSLASGSGNDTLLGGSGSATIVGGDGNNSLIGGLGNNLILSGVGNSTLDGGFGNSTLQANGGLNRFIVRNRSTRIFSPYTLEREPVSGQIDLQNTPPIATTPEVGIVDTYVNFDPILGSPVSQFDPGVPDNSPSITKSPSFASSDLSSFYNLQYFNLLGQANYGVGNALDNSLSVNAPDALILGMGGNNTLVASGARSTLYGNSYANYASPDLYAYAPVDTRTQAFLDGVMGVAGNNSLVANGGNSYLDGGLGYDDGRFNGSGSNTLVASGANNTVIVSHLADVVSLTGNSNTVITSVDLRQTPDNASEIIVNVIPQSPNSGQVTFEGQRMTASYVAISGAKGAYTDTNSISGGSAPTIVVANSAKLHVNYGISNGTVYASPDVADADQRLTVGTFIPDPKNPGNKAVTLSWTTPLTPGGAPVGNTLGYLVNYQLVASNPMTLAANAVTGDTTLLVADVSRVKVGDYVRGDGIEQGTRVVSVDLLSGQLTLSSGLTSDVAVSTVLTSFVETPYLTYLNGTSQDLKGTSINPSLLVDNLPTSFKDPYNGTTYSSENATISYNFKVTAKETVLPAYTDESGNLKAKPLSLIGGQGNDVIYGGHLLVDGALVQLTRPVLTNNPINPQDPGLITTPSPWSPPSDYQPGDHYPTYISGGLGGNDLLVSAKINDGSGNDFTAYEYINGVPRSVLFGGFNTLEGGQGSDTFVVMNGGNTLDSQNGVVTTGAYDHVIKYGKETPNGEHNLVVSFVRFLSLSDTVVDQGKFIDQAWAASIRGGQYIGGNRLDNTLSSFAQANTLLGALGRDRLDASTATGPGGNVLIGGTAYGLDNIAAALADYARGQTSSIYRDTDPVPVNPNGPGTADNSQYWYANGRYDALRNSDTLLASDHGDLMDGGAGNDSMVGGAGSDDLYVSSRLGDQHNSNINAGDVVVGGGGNDWIIYTGSDYYWSGEKTAYNTYTGATLSGSATTSSLGYALDYRGDAQGGQSISNIKLQDGDPIARWAIGNSTSEGNQHPGIPFDIPETGSNQLVGNEFDNTLDGGGVGGVNGRGVGADTLTGGTGADVFVIAPGGYRNGRGDYTNSDSNANAKLDVSGAGPFTFRVRYNATDADYVYIRDFDNDIDRIDLWGDSSDYLIGAAPSSFKENNLSGSVSLDRDHFGIYYWEGGNSRPNLVAEVQYSGTALTVAGYGQTAYGDITGNAYEVGGRIFSSPSDSPPLVFANFAGLGAMYKLDESNLSVI